MINHKQENTNILECIKALELEFKSLIEDWGSYSLDNKKTFNEKNDELIKSRNKHI
jgi:hypothetical protein